MTQGRLFAPGETDAMSSRPGLGGPPVAILSHELWKSAFGRQQQVVGQSVQVDGRPHDIIGIMPPGFDVMDNRTEIWLPIGVHPEIRRVRGNHILHVIGRLKDGVTPQAAESGSLCVPRKLGRTRVEVQEQHVPMARPSRPQDHTLRLQPLQDALVGEARRAIWVLQAAAGLVLLIACANLASLVLARAEARRREFALRANLSASAFAQTLERAVRAFNPSVPIVGLREMDAVFDESIGRPRLLAQLLGTFAALALLLAVIGTYGLLSFMVAERRHEIGIRLAVGATRGGIVALVMKQGLVIASIGLALGIAGALALNRLFASMLFGVEPSDPATLAAVMSTIAIVAALACGLPAWRASRLDPNIVLRADG